MSKTKFYTLSFTWGLPLTLVGCLVAAALIVIGYQPTKWKHCLHFEVGERWGGVNFGPVFITDKNPTIKTRNHEFGHGIQNCYYGFLMPFIVSIPSAIRYWYRALTPNIKHTPYDSIWFEKQATELGYQSV